MTIAREYIEKYRNAVSLIENELVSRIKRIRRKRKKLDAEAELRELAEKIFNSIRCCIQQPPRVVIQPEQPGEREDSSDKIFIYWDYDLDKGVVSEITMLINYDPETKLIQYTWNTFTLHADLSFSSMERLKELIDDIADTFGKKDRDLAIELIKDIFSNPYISVPTSPWERKEHTMLLVNSDPENIDSEKICIQTEYRYPVINIYALDTTTLTLKMRKIGCLRFQEKQEEEEVEGKEILCEKRDDGEEECWLVEEEEEECDEEEECWDDWDEEDDDDNEEWEDDDT